MKYVHRITYGYYTMATEMWSLKLEPCWWGLVLFMVTEICAH